MTLPRSGLLLPLSLLATTIWAADATTPIDYTDRDTRFTPSGSVKKPETQAPTQNQRVQEKRVDLPTVTKPVSAPGERQAPLEVKETRAKAVREKQTRQPDVIEPPQSGFNHRTAGISPATDMVKPPTVAKYQDSLTAASASNMARFPALDRATTAKINRFVFRKNPADASAVTQSSTVIPAAGGSAVKK